MSRLYAGLLSAYCTLSIAFLLVGIFLGEWALLAGAGFVAACWFVNSLLYAVFLRLVK